MTPAIDALRRSKIAHTLHEYTHDTLSESYGLEAAEKMAVSEQRVFKTLVVRLNTSELVVGVIPVSAMLSMKHIAKAVGAKKAQMAPAAQLMRSTGYVLGGVSPLGQKKNLTTLVDSSAQNHATIYVSAGRRGLEIELDPSDLITLLDGTFAEICR